MDKDDKLLYMMVGALLGIPVGMVLFKYLFQQQSQTAQAQAPYGFNYNYDANGNLTSYTPVPLAQNSATLNRLTASTVASATAPTDNTGLFLT